MYTRSYAKEEDGLKLPDNYGGTAFMHKDEVRPEPEVVYSEPEKREIKISMPLDDPTEKVSAKSISDEALARGKLFSLSKRLRQIWGNYRLPKLGFEELLLISIAAFVFLSQSEDIECAIALLILAFIG